MTEKRRRRRKQRSEFAFVLKLLITVILVILVFEGRLIYIMFTYDSSGTDSDSYVSSDSELESEKNDTETSEIVISDDMYLAGIADAGVSGGMDTDMEGSEKTGTEEEAEAQTAHDTVSDPDSTAIVREQDTAVDDSYFSDAVFIGDSRMEGFRNASGITEGTFFTSVGMSLSSMTSKEIISSGNDKVTVAAALSGGTYGKIYIMFGANDLGQYSWDEFRKGFVSITERFLEIQPNATLYICSCIYVEEDKVTTGDYINNDNVDKINSIMLDVCEEEGYYYVDFNEILSDGYGSLIEGASSDGIHVTADYCELMLEYLKTHYVTD